MLISDGNTCEPAGNRTQGLRIKSPNEVAAGISNHLGDIGVTRRGPDHCFVINACRRSAERGVISLEFLLCLPDALLVIFIIMSLVTMEFWGARARSIARRYAYVRAGLESQDFAPGVAKSALEADLAAHLAADAARIYCKPVQDDIPDLLPDSRVTIVKIELECDSPFDGILRALHLQPRPSRESGTAPAAPPTD